jgi:hypothetical protein
MFPETRVEKYIWDRKPGVIYSHQFKGGTDFLVAMWWSPETFSDID